MKIRVSLGRLCVRLGRFIQSLALMVMRPDDLIEYSRRSYAKPGSIGAWADPDLIVSGLNPDEMIFWKKIPLRSGRLLLLGLGGGREAIFFGKSGFQVTGVDFVPEMVSTAIQNAAHCGIGFEGITQEISKLTVPAGTYDVVWLSAAMYSSIPTRQRRTAMLKRIRTVIKTDGYFICQFHWDINKTFSPKAERARKVFAFLTRGNLWYEAGDMLWANQEFIHAFSKEDDLRAEFSDGGFETLFFHFDEDGLRGGAVLKLSS